MIKKVDKKEKAQKKLLLKTLKEDFERFNQHWKEMISHEKLIDDTEFLQELAEDIKELNFDALSATDVEQANVLASRLVLHLITTPWGAPFVSEKSLLDAALTYDYQNPMQSDLHALAHNFPEYNDKISNEMVSIFNSLTEVLGKEEKE